MEESLREEAAVLTLPRLPEEWDKEADVVVVGYGGAGAAAAIEAHDVETEVLILEKMPAPGGTTKISGGGVYCGGSSLQKELGIEDSPDEVYKYLMAVAKFEGEMAADPELLKIIAYQAPETFEWCKELGISFSGQLWGCPPYFHLATTPGLTMTGAERHPDFCCLTPAKYRSHWCDGGGLALWWALERAVERRNIRCLFDTPVRGLIASSTGTIRGVLAETKGKQLYIKSKKAIVLSAGGHGYNKWLANGLPRSLACIDSTMKTIPFSNTGDAIAMALALGADYWSIDGGDAVPIALQPAPHRFDLVWSQPRVFVNKQGKRYVNEDSYWSILAVHQGKQEDMIAWAVIDDKVATTLGKELIEERVGAGEVIRAGIIEDLARAIEVNSQGLKETIATWNANVAEGKDPEWNREFGLESINTPPFYAAKMKLNEANEPTGVKINTKAQVIKVDGKPIPRLYAAGRTSGGQFGVYPGCGYSIMTCLIFGRIAGKAAATEVSI